MKLTKTNNRSFMCELEEIVHDTGSQIKIAVVKAIVDYEDRELAKEMGFTWSAEKGIWVKFLTRKEFHQLYLSQFRKFDIKILGFEFQDGSTTKEPVKTYLKKSFVEEE